MAQAPKCKVCGQSHFGPVHVWPKEERTSEVAEKRAVLAAVAFQGSAAETVAAAEALRKAQAVERVAEGKRPRGRPKEGAGFDRAAYMREYRAKRSAAGDGSRKVTTSEVPERPPMRCVSHGELVEQHMIRGQEVVGCPYCLGLKSSDELLRGKRAHLP